MVGRSAGRVVVMVLVLLCLSALDRTSISPAAQVVAAAHAPSSPEVVGGLHGPQPFVTLFCQFPDVLENIGLPSHYEGLLGDAEPGIADYWTEVSYGQINLAGSRVTRWYLMPHPSSAYPLLHITPETLGRLAEDCTSAADADVFFPDYVGINLVFNLWKDTAYGGKLGLLLDNRERLYGVTWLSLGGFGCQSAIAHEMGHAFGLTHSANARGEEHRNPWDVMSAWDSGLKHRQYGHIAQHPIAYHKDLLGWIPAARKFIAQPGTTNTITLERLAQPATENYLIVEIPIPGAPGCFYTVESRRRVGYDRNLPADGVVIHRIDPHSYPAAVVLAHDTVDGVLVASAWRPGDVFTDAQQGIRIAVDRATDTGYMVAISTSTMGK